MANTTNQVLYEDPFVQIGTKTSKIDGESISSKKIRSCKIVTINPPSIRLDIEYTRPPNPLLPVEKESGMGCIFWTVAFLSIFCGLGIFNVLMRDASSISEFWGLFILPFVTFLLWAKKSHTKSRIQEIHRQNMEIEQDNMVHSIQHNVPVPGDYVLEIQYTYDTVFKIKESSFGEPSRLLQIKSAVEEVM